MNNKRTLSLKSALASNKTLKAIAAESDGDSASDISVSSSAMSSREVREGRCSHIPVKPSACLFNFDTKGKAPLIFNTDSSDDGGNSGRRTRSSVDRGSFACSLNKVTMTKSNVRTRSIIPVVLKADKVSKSKGVKKSRENAGDSDLHTTSTNENDEPPLIPPARTTTPSDPNVQRKASHLTKTKGKGSTKYRASEPESKKEMEPNSGTFTREVHEVGHANRNQQSSNRRQSYTTYGPEKRSPSSSKLADIRTSNSNMITLPSVNASDMTEPMAKQSNSKVGVKQQSQNQREPINVIHPNPIPRSGPASRTNKVSARAPYEPDSIYVAPNRSDEESSDAQPILPQTTVIRPSVVSLEEVVVQRRKNTMQAARLDDAVTTSAFPFDQNVDRSNMPNDCNYEPCGSATVACLVDSDPTEYRLLKNVIAKDHVGVPLNSTTVRYAFPQSLVWLEIYPGVLSSVCYDDQKTRVGYVRIGRRTVKPIERNRNHNMTFSVIDGTVAVKSAIFYFNESEQPCLKSEELFKGCCFTIPPNTMYSIENWTENEASLLYTVSKED